MKHSELNLVHKPLVAHIRTRLVPGVVWHHSPNGGWRDARQGALFKHMGTRAGWPDLEFLAGGEFFGLELKAPKGRPTESQLETLDAIRNAGGHGVVAEGLDEAIRCLSFWGLIK